MIFNSFEYILFLPIVFLLYWFVFKQAKSQNILIVVASYIFYGLWFSLVSNRSTHRGWGNQTKIRWTEKV